MSALWLGARGMAAAETVRLFLIGLPVLLVGTFPVTQCCLESKQPSDPSVRHFVRVSQPTCQSCIQHDPELLFGTFQEHVPDERRGIVRRDLDRDALPDPADLSDPDTLHASGSIVGLVDGIAQAVRNIVDGFSGAISDKLRTRKSIVLAGYLLAALAKPFMGLSTTWESVLAGRLTDRLAAGIRSAPRDALVADSVRKGDRGRGFGLEGLGEHTGAFLGPVLTLILLFWLSLDLRTIFFLALVPGLLAVAMVLPVREQPPPAAPRSKAGSGPRQLPAAYWKFLLATAIFSLGNSTNSFLILRTHEAGASLVSITLIYAAYSLVAALVSYPLGALSDRWGRRTLLLGSYAVFLMVYLGFSLTENLAVIVGLFLVYGLYHGVFRSVGKALASDLVPEHLRASGIGWFSATAGLLQLVASLVAGLLWDKVGHASVFIYGAISAAAGILGLLLLVSGRAGAKSR